MVGEQQPEWTFLGHNDMETSKMGLYFHNVEAEGQATEILDNQPCDPQEMRVWPRLAQHLKRV